jgi:hypothetical protein
MGVSPTVPMGVSPTENDQSPVGVSPTTFMVKTPTTSISRGGASADDDRGPPQRRLRVGAARRE